MKAFRPLPCVLPLLTLFLTACGEDEPILPVNSAPTAPVYLEPANEAGGQFTVLDLRWQASVDPDNDPVTYELYFGTTPNPPLIDAHRTSTWYTPATLQHLTTYYWKVVARDDHDHASSGGVWSFTTGGVAPTSPTPVSPANFSEGQPISPTVSWTSVSGATSYAVQVSTMSTFSDLIFADSGLSETSRQVTGLDSAMTYYWRVMAFNSFGGSGWSPPWIFSTYVACPESVSYEGTSYGTVVIGSQCWFRENLKVGTAILGIGSQSDNDLPEKYCYEDDPEFCAMYGGLYQWGEVMGYTFTPGRQGLCPPGWHIPTVEEFDALCLLANDDGNGLKAVGQGSGSGTGTDSTGFAGLLGGYRLNDGTFGDVTVRGGFWTSNPSGGQTAYGFHLVSTHGGIYQLTSLWSAGLSARCLKD